MFDFSLLQAFRGVRARRTAPAQKDALDLSEEMLEQPVPAVVTQPSAFLVSCLPEAHEERLTFEIRVDYHGSGSWGATCRTRHLRADGSWSLAFAWTGSPDSPSTDAEFQQFQAEEDAWRAEHRFDQATALHLAQQAAPRLRYRGYTVSDALSSAAASQRDRTEA